MRAIASCLRYNGRVSVIARSATGITRQPTLLSRASRSTVLPVRQSTTSNVFGIRKIHASTVARVDIPDQSNRLITEKSPYLLQHAYNPVDWYPWGQEAIQKAKAENKPIFLSIGYSTCHWCHVMEHESFQNAETAKFMNEHFINIKVDREENPAVDKLYMTYVQLITGRGGWPLSVFLTPELEPFYGGTYFPPGDQYGSPGFRTLLERVSEIWEAAPDKLREEAQGTMAQMRNYFESKVSGGEDAANHLDPDALITAAFEHFNKSFDIENGGFTQAPKFPTPVQLNFLFDYYGYFAKDKTHGDNAKRALEMALFTLNKIAMGGIHDHIGSGFHRYSTDKFWHVPHFEKMLYDQAQLLSSYVTAYQISKDDGYANVARDIIHYVARDLQHSAGGFYSAEDADSYPEDDPSKKLEGAFYVWEEEKLDEILDVDEAKVFKRYYGVAKNGNVNPALDPHGELEDQNVLAEEIPVSDVAKELNLTPEETTELLKDAKEKLWKYREEKRSKPHCDDKILTSWNGLMISGLASAAQTLKDKSTLDLAIKAATFIHKELYDSQAHTLLRSYRCGPSKIEGCLDDYSYMIQGLLNLYDATFDEKWIQWAYDLQQKQNELFYDSEKGGFYNVSQGDNSILVRIKDEQDGAEPSANSVSLNNLVRLGTLLEQESYVTMARKTVGSFSTSFSRFPYAMPSLLGSFMLMVNGIKQIVLTGQDETKMEPFIRVMSDNFMPNKLVVRAKKGGILAEKNPIIAQLSLEPSTQAYVCENFSCGLPVEDAGQLRKKITHQQ